MSPAHATTPAARSGLIFTPAHLVALAEGADHDVADLLCSHAATWHNGFIAPLLAAGSAEAFDECFTAARQPFAELLRRISASEALLREANAAPTGSAPGLVDSLRRLRGGPGFSELQWQDVEWSAEVYVYGHAALMRALLAHPEVTDWPRQAVEVLAQATPDQIYLASDVLLLLSTVATLLAEPDRVVDARVRERLCERLFEAAERFDDYLRGLSIDWRQLRDQSSEDRVRRMEAYARGVVQGFSERELDEMEAESLHARPFFSSSDRS